MFVKRDLTKEVLRKRDSKKDAPRICLFKDNDAKT